MAVLGLWQLPDCCGFLTSVHFGANGFLILKEAALILWCGYLGLNPEYFFSLLNDSVSYIISCSKNSSFNLAKMEFVFLAKCQYTAC